MLTPDTRRSASAARPLMLTALTSLTALTALVLAGCGTTRVTTTAGTDTPAASAVSGASTASAKASASGGPADVRCPGETPSPSAAATGSATGAADRPGQDAPPDYADNHAYQDAFPLLGQDRCKGVAEVKRIAAALEPLRTGRDFVPGDVQGRLAGLGYAPAKLRVYQNGSTGVGYTVDLAPVCLEGTMSLTEVRTVAHGGYPDGTGCSMPRGGH
ncbi:hypothetical protein OG500_32930 [Kitasatospora sp. NBC_01250]|uniref:hypothetical protein n=1 Tax=Kitasatospora sp. NBC_01250 TaxID=2903571 RepID=UPI002E3256F7|nr:hypothetical protein [Kitasatospora sp. NBC_01250]